MDSTSILTAIAGAFLLAGFVKGVIGPWLADSVDRLAWAGDDAGAPSLVTNVWQAVVGGGLFALARRLWPMLTGICIGTVVGVMLLPHDESGRATVWLGLALAGQDQRRNVPGVVFRRPAAAWRPSGAARALVID